MLSRSLEAQVWMRHHLQASDPGSSLLRGREPDAGSPVTRGVPVLAKCAFGLGLVNQLVLVFMCEWLVATRWKSDYFLTRCV